MIETTIPTLDEIVPYTTNYFENIALRNNALVTTVFPAVTQFGTEANALKDEMNVLYSNTVNYSYQTLAYQNAAQSILDTMYSEISSASASATASASASANTATTKATASANSANDSANSATSAQNSVNSINSTVTAINNTAMALTQVGISTASIVDGELILSYASPITSISFNSSNELLINY